MNRKTWRERVAEARERGSFTGLDFLDATSWCTCAVGEQHAAVPSVVLYFDAEQMGPRDDVLQGYGGDYGFVRAVHRNDFDMADRMLDYIEDRVLQLKREGP